MPSDPYSGPPKLLLVENNIAAPKNPKMMRTARNTIPTMARNLAHFAASVKWALVDGSMDREKSSDVSCVCSINSVGFDLIRISIAYSYNKSITQII
jgi:hypothetical protein